MRVVQITPGAGGMFCGNCFRDNALVAALRRLAHEPTLIPLYLPLRLEDEDQSSEVPIFYGGLNVYLEQRWSGYRHCPKWFRRWLASRALLQRLARAAARTRPEDVGDMTVSMLQGEHGRQAVELDALIDWLRSHGAPEVACLSNGLLMGLARRVHRDLGIPVVAMLQGEDEFLDRLSSPFREQAWEILRERAREVHLIAPSRYYASRMEERLGFEPGRIRVVPNGIPLEGFHPPAEEPSQPPAIGYFARLCPDKGVDRIVDAYLRIRERNRIPDLRLKLGGGLGPSDEDIVIRLRKRIEQARLSKDVEWLPNATRAEKQEFLRSMTVFSVPAPYSEAFGLYLLEALASGVPVVQPRHAAFPEVIESTGGGVLYDPEDPDGLVNALESLLLDASKRRALASRGRETVLREFSDDAMAARMTAVFENARKEPTPEARTAAH